MTRFGWVKRKLVYHRPIFAEIRRRSKPVMSIQPHIVTILDLIVYNIHPNFLEHHLNLCGQKSGKLRLVLPKNPCNCLLACKIPPLS